jgi:hypothetical protein
MAGYDLDISINKRYEKEVRSFLKFLQRIGKKYPVSFRFRKINSEKYYIIIDGTPGGKIDALFQEIILNRALYYYSCALENKNIIISKVIVPVYSQLLESRFDNIYHKLLRKNVLGRFSDNFMPGDFNYSLAHDYEILFRKWDIRLINNYDFIRGLDDLLTNYMLDRLSHKSGQKSPKFNQLVERCSNLGPVMDREQKKRFNKVHSLRTRGLHRLEKNLSHDDVYTISSEFYFYFQYIDEFLESQKEKTTKLYGKLYRRIKYGKENYIVDGKKIFIADVPCHDCGAVEGQYHCDGCDVEQCPRCLGQYLGCSCKLDSDFD